MFHFTRIITAVYRLGPRYLYQMVTQKYVRRQELSLLFDLLKAFDYTESSYKSEIFSENTYFHHACATFHELPSDICTMIFSVSTADE